MTDKKMKGISNPLWKTEFMCKCHKSSKCNFSGQKCCLVVERKTILLMDAKKTQVFARTSFFDIATWTSSNGTFAYDVTSKKPGDASVRYIFVTKEGHQISEALKCRVEDMLEEEKRKVDPDDLEKLGFNPAAFLSS
mmetsp:Transcript_10788/g.30328  ORF Transcript_10788/g.30328 Transcript_10788/m.30328 type:complete len:137 (-) Transcript_10788:140-550(-)|eukprot:CAMPEP_0119146152 /NCGR_PEP_ID=MMETSP1310-20130426/38484_1 /TAXON_ID=464262 /ORGANISM="Genus nov. species nov., Strain RCC2339" /LENGTH=136 /DNA_ID=CAMNT_0007138019 /DNA_START=243 /DNA_END=653 /DNA_ORIENTATION=-